MNMPNVLIIADKEDAKVLPVERQTKHWHIFWEIINYDELHKRVNEIRRIVLNNNIHFVLYSRNDQVGNRISIGPVTRKLRTGYSSFSGIDKQNRVHQMKTCFEDFVNCEKKLGFDTFRKRIDSQDIERGTTTFSLIFDTEQLGGVKYGLPRILELLDKYGAKVTFFVTNLMKKVYPDVIEGIRRQGHEVGIHGMWHEFMSDLREREQVLLIRSMIRDFGGDIYGANFVGRMNIATLRALVENGISYFVNPFITRYNYTAYPMFSTTPRLVHLSNGNISMIPISIETYGYPWFSIRNTVDSVLAQNRRTFTPISILCHPFRDGNLSHINVTEKLLYHLTKKGLIPIPLRLLNEHLGAGYFPCTDVVHDVERLLHPKKVNPSVPRTKQDLAGIIPENLIMLYRIIRRGHTIF